MGDSVSINTGGSVGQRKSVCCVPCKHASPDLPIIEQNKLRDPFHPSVEHVRVCQQEANYTRLVLALGYSQFSGNITDYKM